MRNPKEKIFQSTTELNKVAKQVRGNIVFTNGCFDILHRGHVEYLYKARQRGEFLIVGVNSDASVKRLKGDERPVVDEYSRCFLLASLEMVDAVIIFDEDTPARLIAEIVPDVLVKGGDYQVSEVVGGDTVTKNGGVVEIIPFVTGFSTTDIVTKIKSLNSR